MDFVVIQEFQPPELDNDYSAFLPSKSEYRNVLLNDFHCQQPWQRVLIRNTGEVCPCCAFFSSELSLGNVKNSSIHDLWNSQEMHHLRKLHKDGNYAENPWCKKCVNVMSCGSNQAAELLQIKSSNKKS